jgi:flagellar hook protein FlgE
MSVDAIFSTAVSGLQANAARVGVAAFNVVNANTDGFKARAVNASGAQPSGVSTSVTQTDRAVDVAQEFVGMIQAEAGYGANAEVVNTASRMTGALLDILA